MKELTLADIQNAVRLIKENMPPDKWIETEFGFLKLDGSGNCKEIMMKDVDVKALAGIIGPQTNYTIFGIKIIKTKLLKDIDKKTLSDKQHSLEKVSDKLDYYGGWIKTVDVITSLKEVQKEANITLSNDNLTISWSKFKEIFGEDLL